MEGLWGLDSGVKEDVPAAWKSLTEVSGEAARILEVPLRLEKGLLIDADLPAP